ncbi:hypothetical protein C0991_011895 [Blastosporella zonata]|nr:hypothetical protein C0991_011895 [Blastosporella zonata]
MQAAVDTRRLNRPDTYDLREQIQQEDVDHLHAHADAASATYTDDEETSVMEDDSEGEENEDYIDDDGSSSLSIPNESIDFDLVYSLHSFAATVEGQANVVKGDSLFLMDDSNSYWWLVRVLKTQEVGYIPAENIETPFERLARLNKHRNVDVRLLIFLHSFEAHVTISQLASATPAELNDNLHASQDKLRTTLSSRAGSNQSSSPYPLGSQERTRSIRFGGPRFPLLRYPRAIWREEDMMETDEDEEDWVEHSDLEDIGLSEEHRENGLTIVEPEDGMDWEDGAVSEIQHAASIPPVLQAGGGRSEHVQSQQEDPQWHQDSAPLVQAPPLRTSSSRERLQLEAQRSIDPAEATETRKLTVTPTIARSDEHKPLLPSAIQQERIREEEHAQEARKQASKKMAPPVSSASLAKAAPAHGGKLRKERDSDEDSGNGKDKKKKSILGNIFGRSKKDKKDKNSSIASLDSAESSSRMSEESRGSSVNRPSNVDSIMSPTTATAMQQQQQQSLTSIRVSPDSKRSEPQTQPHTPERGPAVSQHASQLRQRDQQQQALYQQQYLNRSPSSPPEAQPSYGLQSASAIMPPSSYHTPITSGSSSGLGPPTARPRPGSLILTQSVMDAGGPGPVPELSVIRVFAGKNLQTEATFKTVLLNSLTTSSELIKQATQRFRLSLGDIDGEGEYYLTVKQVEGGGFAVLRPEEKPLVVFEQLVEEAMEMPKVKRSSVGSISSVASNLSMHPAIKKLPMNDFTDDSAVKFYLNRRGDDGMTESALGHAGEVDETLIADSSFGDVQESPVQRHLLTVSTNHNVTPERFTSPSFRFALQLVIYPDDLPEDMVFHPQTEAIVFKDTLREADAALPVTVSPNMRRKIFVFPKNATVAEVIEIGLERFGISDGVVDGGDEIEDKSTKRRSSTRVRYGLSVNTGSHAERELSPSSRVVEAFPRPPTFKATDRPTPTSKRRSVDSTLVLGTMDDVNPDDPVFVLRRAISYRNFTYRHRMSAPLDELALHKLHRDSTSSSLSDPSSPSHDHKPSRQEIIARQREATRANQRAILSAQTNSVRGMDVLLPGNAMLRSSRYDVNDRMRYSYVEPDGETYDISDIVEEELREHNFAANRSDLLESVLGRKDVVGEKLNRVLSKIKSGKIRERDLASLSSSADSMRQSRSISEYSVDDATSDRRQGARSVSPSHAGGPKNKTPTDLSQTLPRSSADRSRPGTTTPTGKSTGHDRRHPSIASVISDLSGYGTPATHNEELINEDALDNPRSVATPKPQSQQRRRPVIPRDDFGVGHMLNIIEYMDAKPKVSLPALDPVDALLFGRPLDLQALHPHIRDIYAPTFKQLDEMDKV